MLGNLVAASNTQVDAALADEGWDVSGGQEDQSDGQVLNESDVEAGFTAELDITAGEEVESCLLQTSFCRVEFAPSVLSSLAWCFRCVHVGIGTRMCESRFEKGLAFGHGEEKTAFQAIESYNR